MSKRDSQVALRQMLAYAQEAVDLCQGKERSDLDKDRLLELALVRLMEIIGEAANRVPSTEQAAHPEIPWAQIVGLRNRLIHGYDAVDLNIVWQIIQQDLPPLIVTLREITSD
ncbi:MAG: DUF86 domain-containing protein [Anaerolineae bacterium]|nr:DUF86 domain-containing protein [Anaerolineae bacterium]